MDIESDGSERWEDFFGSSTEIGLGFLDTLANNFNEEARQLVESSGSNISTPLSPPPVSSLSAVSAHEVFTLPRAEDAAHRPPFDGDNGPSKSAPRTLTKAYATEGEPVGRVNVRKRTDKFFNLVSPNVLRMVFNTTESSTSPTGTTPPACTSTFTGSNVGICSPTSGRKPTTTPGSTRKQQHLPLSKGITKLSQMNQEQVEDEDCGVEGEEEETGRRQKLRAQRGLRERLVECRSTCEAAANCTTDAVTMDPSGRCTQSNGHGTGQESEQLQNVSTLQRKIHQLTVGLEESEAGEREWRMGKGESTGEERENDASQASLHATQPAADGLEESSADGGTVTLRDADAMNHDAPTMEDAFVKNCIDSSDHRKTVVEAINLHPNLGSKAAKEAPSRNGTRKLSTPTKPERKTISKASSQSLSDNATSQHNSTSSTSTPSLDTANSGGSVYSSKMSLPTPGTPVLSSRPLSASSICSYSSSSSSSGSEHHHLLLMGGKSAPPSYQASVESLADPSEPEQASSLPRCNGDGVVAGTPVVIAMTMCERAMREIIDSESSYVKDLGQVIRGYLEDWKERACLKPDQLNVLFSNIQQIYDFNFKLLNRLRDARGDPVQISNCFIDLHVEFSCYTKYCTSYPEAISLLTTLLQATHTNALLVSTQKLLKHTLPLGSYLLKPVQRILKYHLLLENLRKHCSDQQVALAHELMKKVAQNIDQMKKKLDQQRLVKELAGILDGWLGPDLSVLGDLLREGHLTEHAKPRIVLLFQSMLIIAKPKEDKRLQFRAYIPCKNIMLVETLPGEPASFNVIPFDEPKGVLKLTARNREEKRHWTQQIKQAMLQHYSDIPERAKELVLQLGDEDERVTGKQYWKRPTNNSPVPEYLERRQQFRRSEMRQRSKKNLLKKDAPVATFRSYSDMESVDGAGTGPAPSEPKPGSTHASNLDECKCDSVKKQLQEEIQSRAETPKHKPSPSLSRSRSEVRDDEQERLKKSQYERRKLSAPLKKQFKVREDSPEGIQKYNHTTIPKRISEMRKRRPKTLTGSSTFYTELDAQVVMSGGEPCSSTEPASIATDASEENVSIEIPECCSPHEETGAKPRAATSIETATDGGAQLKDSDIISKLILDKDQFTKVLNKPLTKKKSFDSSTCVRPVMNPPEPPSTEPPCEEDDRAVRCEPNTAPHYDDGNDEDDHRRQRTVSGGADDDEPIYESLLRNVHVPYKYAPASLALRHSLPCAEKTNSFNCQQSSPPPAAPATPPGPGLVPPALPRRKTRPESDYVTLAYSELGLLERIEGDDEKPGTGVVRRLGSPQISPVHAKTPQLLRNSDTNISYHRENSAPAMGVSVGKETVATVTPPVGNEVAVIPVAENEESASIYACPKQAFLERQGSLNMKTTATQKSILQRFISQHASAISSRMLGSEGNLLAGDVQPLQRKLSDPNGGYGGGSGGSAGHIYKLGSMDLGCRIAHLDYADPKTLFAHQPSISSSTYSMVSNGNTNVLINQESMKAQGHHASEPHDQRDSVLASSSSSDSVCDEPPPQPASGVGGSFDDDANDENSFYERTVEECLEHDFRDSAVYSGDDNDRRADRCTADCGADEQQQNLYETLSPPNRTGSPRSASTHRSSATGPPPPIPTKPAHLGRAKRVSNGMFPATAAIALPTKPPANTRGWVLQQVKRFQ
uniref:DH domain-containing protein n=1 Tax=Anopheles atroparvus TaxID=41427 RepID=A0AAG5D6K5_ANOAO